MLRLTEVNVKKLLLEIEAMLLDTVEPKEEEDDGDERKGSLEGMNLVADENDEDKPTTVLPPDELPTNILLITVLFTDVLLPAVLFTTVLLTNVPLTTILLTAVLLSVMLPETLLTTEFWLEVMPGVTDDGEDVIVIPMTASWLDVLSGNGVEDAEIVKIPTDTLWLEMLPGFIDFNEDVIELSDIDVLLSTDVDDIGVDNISMDGL